jgi:hypothetical protein
VTTPTDRSVADRSYTDGRRKCRHRYALSSRRCQQSIDTFYGLGLCRAHADRVIARMLAREVIDLAYYRRQQEPLNDD